jgi:hypothetical protein
MRLSAVERNFKGIHVAQFGLTNAQPSFIFDRQVGGKLFIWGGGVAIPSATGAFSLAVNAPPQMAALSWGYSNAAIGESCYLGMDASNISVTTEQSIVFEGEVLSGSLSNWVVDIMVLENPF